MKPNYDFLDKLERGMYFEKKEYKETPLYTYEEVKEKLPVPIIEGKKEWIDVYHYAVKILFTNQHKPTKESGYVSNFVDAAFNEDIFLWDTVFMTIFCNLLHPYIPGICSLDNFYCKQFDDGEIPRELVRKTGKDLLLWVNGYQKPLYSYFHNHYGHRKLKEMTNLTYEQMYHPDMNRVIEKNPYLTLDNLNHPLLALAEWESYCHTKDWKRLKMVFKPLYYYYKALQYHLRHANGLYVTDWASMDNSPRNKYLGLGVDISSEMVLFAKNLIDIIEELKKRDCIAEQADKIEEQLKQDIKTLTNLINEKMWDEEEGFYYDITFKEEKIKIKTAAGFFPLLAGVANTNRADRLTNWLKDKDTFCRVHRVPVLAANEEGYDPDGGYWRGSVWAPTNTIILLGLEKYQYHQLAKEIALNHVDVVAKVFQDTHTIWENYPADSISSGNADNIDFVGWSGIGPIYYLIQYGIGLFIDKEQKILRWDLSKELLSKGKIGCKNYWFAQKQADFLAEKLAEKLVISIQTKDTFEIFITYGEIEKKLFIDKDTEIIL